MVGSILGILSSILGLVTSANANEESQTQLDQLAKRQKVAPSIREGESIMREQAAGNAPGFVNKMASVDASQAKTLNQAKDYVSGGGLLGALSEIYTKGNEEKRTIMDANEAFQVQAKDKLAAYLGNVSGGAEENLQSDLNSLGLAKIGIDQAGTQDALNFTNTGLNSIANDKGLLAIINNLLGNSSTGGGSGSDSSGMIGGKSPLTGSYINQA